MRHLLKKVNAISPRKPLLSLTAAIAVNALSWNQVQAAEPPTLKEFMNTVVQTSSAELFNAALIEPKPGATKAEPTEEQWQNLRKNAQTLLSATTTLLLPELKIADASKPAPEGELAPAAIAALRKEKWQAWQAQVSILEQGAKASLKAIDAKNLDALLTAGDPLYGVCDSCHQQFWYPNQGK